MWTLYDRLIDGIDEDIIVDRVASGSSWTVVTAGEYSGLSANIEGGRTAPDLPACKGRPLKEIAELCKSWDFAEAAIGAAAVNAYYNSDKFLSSKALPANNTFDVYEELTAGKKVGMIGHFMHLEGILTKADVYVIEKRPAADEYPEAACEYLLPEMDFVFITGSAFVNKTMPRLLELSKNAHTVIIGPSTTMSDVLFDYGADEVSGLMITDPAAAMHTAVFNGHRNIFKCGSKLRLLKQKNPGD